MRRLLAGVVAVVAAAAAANVATAGTIAVGAGCTVADAITAANTDAPAGGCAAGSGDDAIVLAPDAVYTLTAVADTVDGPNGLPTVTSPITVLGNGATIERSAAAGTPEFRIFNVKRLPLGDDPSLRLEGLTLRGGLVRSAYPFSPVCAGGGALHARGAIVELDRVTIAGSEVREPAPGLDCFAAGGGIDISSGTLVVTDSAIRDNRAATGGGGIHALVTATTIVSTTVDGNRAENPAGLQADGGGVLARGGDTFIRRSTISDNVAGHGGGIAVDTELSTIANTTISGNRAEVGGGIVSHSGLALLNATVAGNAADAAGGLWIANPQMVVRNTIIAGNTAAGDPARPNADCATAENEPLAGDHNLFGLGTGCHTAGDTLVAPASVFADVLGALAANAPGSTETHALLAGSPALDRGDAATCAGADVGGVDQRGVAREAACDIGAFERTAAAPPGPGAAVMQVVTGSASTPPFPASPVTLSISGLLAQGPVPVALLDLSLTGACSRFIPTDPCRELALSQSLQCGPGDPCREARLGTRCVAFAPTDPCVEGNQAIDLFVELRRHADAGAAPVLRPATLANATPTGFDVVYDAVVPGVAATRQTLRFAIGAGQPLRFGIVRVGAPLSPRFHVTFELERAAGAPVDGPLWTVAASGTVAPPPADTTPPVLTVPGDVVVDATSPAGAPVDYAVSATDDQDAAPTIACAPASGGVFAVGTTTVACTATDDAGNAATRTLAVRVRGAAEQLVRLVEKTLAYVDQPALRPALAARLKAAADAIVARRPTAACNALALYTLAVRLAPSSVLTTAEKSELVADASRIRAVLAC